MYDFLFWFMVGFFVTALAHLLAALLLGSGD